MRKLPDKIYLILENAIDEIVEELEKEENFRGPIHHMVEREFRFMMHEKGREGKRNKRRAI